MTEVDVVHACHRTHTFDMVHTRSGQLVHRFSLLLLVILFAAAACSTDATVAATNTPVIDDSSAPESAAGADEAPAAAPENDTGTAPPTPEADAPDADAPEPTETTPESDTDSASGSQDDGRNDDLLSLAFAKLQDVNGYRVTISTAQTLQIPALGADSAQVLDPDRPTTVFEIAGNGDNHSTIDLGPLLAPLAGGDTQAVQALDGVSVELWNVDDRLVVDTRSYQALVDLNPNAIQDLGVFRPGLFAVDLSGVGPTASKDLVAAIAGSPPPNPQVLGEQLPQVLEGVEQDPNNPRRFTARTSFEKLTSALGGDIEVTARGAAAGIAPTIGVTVDDLTEAYLTFYREADSAIELVLDEDGSLLSLKATTDMSNIFATVLDPVRGIDLGLSASEVAEMRNAFANTFWRLETLSTYDTDAIITITPPADVTEDRTAETIQFFEDAGF